MFTPLSHRLLVSVGVAVAIAACHETDLRVSVASTTSAAISNDAAVLQLSKARCRRAAECNRVGVGHDYADEAQCLHIYQEEGLPLEMLRACPNGVDKERLDGCVAVLMDQHCDSDMGPVTAPDCNSYCR